MSRLTGNDAYDLMEAYSAVYQPRVELTEEQVWEEVENWVNSLVEEGYDLSEYTWENMYEEYLSEIPTSGQMSGASARQRQAQAQAARNRFPTGLAGRPLGSNSPAAPRPQAPAVPRPQAPAAPRPQAPASAKPAPTSTAAAPTAERRTPTSAELRAAQGARSTALAAGKTRPEAEKAAVQAGIDRGTKLMGGPSGPGKIDTSSVSRDLARANTPSSSSTPAAKPTPTTQKRPMGSVKPGSLVSSFDMFDIVKGYLIDEGYADTEDAAIAIMASMSEDWKTAIISEARAEGVKPYKPGPTQAEVRADARRARENHVEKSKGQKGYGDEEKFKDWKDRSTPGSTLKRKGGEEETVSQRMNREKPYAKRMTGQMAREYGSRHAAEVTRVVKGAGEPQAVTYPRKGRDEKKKVSKEIIRREELELYNYILSHLLDEGYASDVETAEGIIENMSDEWILSILG